MERTNGRWAGGERMRGKKEGRNERKREEGRPGRERVKKSSMQGLKQ